MIVQIEYLSSEYFGLRFPYSASLVAQVRRLAERRWNRVESRWEVHVSHLQEVMNIFNLRREGIDKRILRSYQIHCIRHCRVRLRTGNVLSQLTGPDLPAQKIDNATSFFVPGHQYMPRFVQGKWDGKRHLFDKRKHTFPSGLLPKICAILDGEGIEYEKLPWEPLPEPPDSVDKPRLDDPAEVLEIRRKAEAAFETRAPDLELRDYQQEAVDAALNARRGVLEMATGGGKTAVATWIIHELGRAALFLVHTRDLLYQTRQYMEAQLGVKVGQVGDGTIDIQPVTVATVQTCSKALGVRIDKTDDDEPLEADPTETKGRKLEITAFIQSVPVVFFDECHHLPADCCYSLAMKTEAAEYRFGLSATPYRSDRQDLMLEAALGAKIYRASASDLIAKGYLVPPHITFYPVPRLRVVNSAPDYQSIVSDYIVDNANRNKLIAGHAKALAAKKKSVLILVAQVRHGEALRGYLPDVPLVQGADPAEKRQEIFRKLEKKKTLIVIATTLADEGLDIPSLNAVILASGGRSETRALQRIGRGLRIAPGKKEAVVIDFYDDAPYLKDHSARRHAIYVSEERFKVTTEGFEF